MLVTMELMTVMITLSVLTTKAADTCVFVKPTTTATEREATARVKPAITHWLCVRLFVCVGVGGCVLMCVC